MPVLQQIISNNQSHCAWHSPHCIKRVTYIFFSSDGMSVFTIIDWKWVQTHLTLSSTGLEHTPAVNLQEYPPGRRCATSINFNTVQFRKYAPRLIFFKGPFCGAYFWRGLIFRGAYVWREVCVQKSIGL